VTRGVAIVGCGLIGGKRARALPVGWRVVTVHDPDPARAGELLASLDPAVHPGARPVGSAAEAAGADGVELVIVATPHDRLAPAGLVAVAAGRHVLVEKPGADRLEPLLELREAAERAGRTVRVGFNHRFHPALRRARELAANGGYGPVFGVRARYGHGGRVGYEKEWRAVRSISGGGELIDQGMHLIDLTRCFLGDVDLAFAELRTDFWAMEVEDNAYLALRGEGGGFAWLHASWTEWKNLFSLEIALETAKLEITGLGGSYGTERLTVYEMSEEMGPPASTTEEWTDADGSWRDELADVVAGIDGRPTAGATLDDCIAAFRVVEEAYGR
jgi:predicted dehydrogenase